MGKEKEKETLTERDDAGRERPEDSGSLSDGVDNDRREMRRRKSSRKHARRRRRSPSSESESDYSSSAESSASGTEEEEGSEAEMRRRRKRRRKDREHEKEKERTRKDKEREKKRRRKKEREEKEKKKKKKKREKEKEKKKMGPVTNSWGKYGVIRETDIFMEDHNTATFPSKKYYNLDGYHQRMILKEIKKGSKKTSQLERTVFNDEEQRRQELLKERERQKEEQVQALKYSMQSGMAQAMKEQAQLREEMNYQYRLGNFEAAAAIQRRLDPDVPM
ncbi:hypothetical protein EJ110_NYTH03262 [Nymphaea thermarum]|nr:hypothetical protein EJ110_NYTH03262 [Nymphaea thermarum]